MTKKNLQDEFRDLSLNEPITVEIEGKEVILDVRVEDLYPIMQSGQGDGGVDLEEVGDILKDVLRRTYLSHYDEEADRVPDDLDDRQKRENREDMEWINGLLLRHLPDLFEELSVGLGWQDREEIQRRKRQALEDQGK